MSETISQMNSYYSSERHDMVAFLPTKYHRILEIGCAEGKFRELVNPEAEYWGIELNGSVAKTAAKVLDKVLVGEYLDVYKDLPDGYFDLVICNDVIEHMPDECVFFKSIKTKMTSEANIIASLPNVRFAKNLYELLMQKDWRYRDSGLLDRTHLRFFTKKSILRSVKECGFDVAHIKGINKIYNLDTKRKNTNLIKRIAQVMVARFLSIVLGEDVLYLHYAFRANPC